jgi:hypothetical protein
MQNHLSSISKELLVNTNKSYLFLLMVIVIMPSIVTRNNLKRKQATVRKRAIGQKARVAQKKRVITRRATTTKPRVTKPRLTPAIKLAVGLAGLLIGSSVARGAGHPSPTPNQATHANTTGGKISVYTQQRFDPHGGFSSTRFSQRVTTNGPVVFVEQTLPNRGRPTYLQMGIAQKVKVPGNVLASLGLRTPELIGQKINVRNTDYGIILAKKGTSIQAQHWGSLNSTRYTVETPVKKSKVDVSYSEPRFISEGSAVRVGVSKLEKTLGVNLGKLSTSMGLTFAEGRSGKVDVSVFYPTKFGGMGLKAFHMPSGQKRVAGVLVINY